VLSTPDATALSVGQSFALVSPAETAEPIEMPFGFEDSCGSKHKFYRIR